MAVDRPWDTALGGAHAPRLGTRKPRASAATRRLEGAPAATAADGDGPTLLGAAVKVVDELAAVAAPGAAGDCGRLAPPRVSALLGVEEPPTIRSADDQSGTARSNSADEPRQSSVGRTTNPRRAAEAGRNGLASDGVEVHGPTSSAAVAGVAHVFGESRQGFNRTGFLLGAHGDLSQAVRACDADPQSAAAGPFQCDRASDRGMDGAATARGVRRGGGTGVSDSGPRSCLWRAIFTSG